MLGLDLLDVLADRRPGDNVLAPPLSDLDITDSAAVAHAVSGIDVVVNCAAWTDVDAAESNEAEAFDINARGAASLARACAATGSRLVHMSTDYVFAGDAVEPYREDAPLSPRSAYGRTKAAGEWAVRTYLPDASWVLRTAWLYGWRGRNFVSTIIRLLDERGTVDVVADQHGQPTWTVDVAHRIVDLIERDVPAGTYHATSSGETTWLGLARHAVRLAGGDPVRVRATTTAAFPRPAPRPAWSVLEHGAWERLGLASLPSWQEALAAAMAAPGAPRLTD